MGSSNVTYGTPLSKAYRGRPAVLESRSCEFRVDRGQKQTIWSEKLSKNGQKSQCFFLVFASGGFFEILPQT